MRSWTQSITSKLAALRTARAALLLLPALALYLHFTSFDLGWSDSYGYISQALRMARFQFAGEETTLRSLGLSGDGALTTPLGYWFIDGRSVPMWPFGTSALMVPLIWLFGPKGGFLLQAIMGYLCLVLVYSIGRRIAGSLAGIVAILLSMLWPPLFALSTVAMSDVGGTALTLLVCWCLLKSDSSQGWVVCAGCAIGLAFLVRPNLILLVIPAALFLFVARRTRRFPALVAGMLPAMLLQLWVNHAYYGGFLKSSYREQADVFRLDAIGQGISAYLQHAAAFGGLLLVPFILFALCRRSIPAPFKAFAIGWLILLHLFFGLYPSHNEWLFSRFVLPSHIPLIVLAAAGIVSSADRFSHRKIVRFLHVVPVAACVFWNAWFLDRSRFLFNKEEWARISSEAQRVEELTGRESLVFSYSLSGVLRYYQGIMTANLRTEPSAAREVLDDCFRRGRAVFAITTIEPDDQYYFKLLPYNDLGLDMLDIPVLHHVSVHRLFPSAQARWDYVWQKGPIRLDGRVTDPFTAFPATQWRPRGPRGGGFLQAIGRSARIDLRLLVDATFRVRLRIRIPGSKSTTSQIELRWNNAEFVSEPSVSSQWTVVEFQTPPVRQPVNSIQLRCCRGATNGESVRIICDFVEVEPVSRTGPASAPGTTGAVGTPQ